jgi:hypothetical protein
MSRDRCYGRSEQVGSRGLPAGYATWYDWALVYRYWTGDNEGLRQPYLLEIKELLRLGAGLTSEQLAERIGVTERTVKRWKSRLGNAA